MTVAVRSLPPRPSVVMAPEKYIPNIKEGNIGIDERRVLLELVPLPAGLQENSTTDKLQEWVSQAAPRP